MENDTLLSWIAGRGREVGLLTSLCTGWLLLGKAALIDGRRATTHSKALDLMRELFPAGTVIEDRHVVADGDLITSAGIDMALQVVAHHRDEVARATA
jgi:transcriptional regulator GlxA family with amidase domain